MGIIVSRKDHEDVFQRVNRLWWVRTLQLAEIYGWCPAGTRAPAEDEECSQQLVGAEDALALGHALDRALQDIPDGSEADRLVAEHQALARVEQQLADEGLPPGDVDQVEHLGDSIVVHFTEHDRRRVELTFFCPPANLVELFQGNIKPQLADMAAFCRGGAFYICD